MRMKRATTIAFACAGALVLPVSIASAKPESAGQAGGAKSLAVKQCKQERDADRAAFRATYGQNAMRNCKRANSGVETEDVDANVEAFRNAAQACRAEREADPVAFQETYGTNQSQGKGSKRNAFGKCVSGKVRDDGESEDTNGDEEQEATPVA